MWVCHQVTGQPAAPASVRCKAGAASSACLGTVQGQGRRSPPSHWAASSICLGTVQGQGSQQRLPRCGARPGPPFSTPGRDLLAWGTFCSGCPPQMRAPPSSGGRYTRGKALTSRLPGASVSRWKVYLPRRVHLLQGHHCSHHHLLLLPSSAAIKIRTQFLLVTYVGFRSGLLGALGPHCLPD